MKVQLSVSSRAQLQYIKLQLAYRMNVPVEAQEENLFTDEGSAGSFQIQAVTSHPRVSAGPRQSITQQTKKQPFYSISSILSYKSWHLLFLKPSQKLIYCFSLLIYFITWSF